MRAKHAEDGRRRWSTGWRRAAAAFCLLAAFGVAGQETEERAEGASGPLVTDRPDFTESARSVDRGRVQVEAGVERSRDDGEFWDVGAVLVRIGLGGGWELRLEPGSYSVSDPAGGERLEGFGDATVGAKVELPSPAGGVEAALLVGAELPTGASAVGGSGLRPAAVFALARDVRAAGREMGIGLNLGYREIDGGGEGFGQGSASLAVGTGLGERLGVFVEWFGFSREEPGGGSAHYLDGGFTWLWSPDLQLDLYGGVGLTSGAAGSFAGAGLSVRF